MKREKLDATCPVGWYEFDLAIPGNRRVGWWNGSDLYGNKACTCRIGDRYSNFIGPLVEATNTTCNGCGKPLEKANAWMEDGCPCNSPKGCNIGNEQISQWRLELFESQDESGQKSLQEQLEKTEASLGRIVQTAIDAGWDQIGPLEAFIAQLATAKSQAEKAEREHEETLKERDECEEWIDKMYLAVVGQPPQWSSNFDYKNAADMVEQVMYAKEQEIGRHVTRVKELTEENEQLNARIKELEHDKPTLVELYRRDHPEAFDSAKVQELAEENKRLDKTICDLEMDLDAARKRYHYAETAIKDLYNWGCSEAASWFGRNADRFFQMQRALNKIEGLQSKLSQKPEAKLEGGNV